jgi:hypothetical protein
VDQKTNPVLKAATPSNTFSDIDRASLAGTLFKQLNPIIQFLELATRKPANSFSIEDALAMEERNRMYMMQEADQKRVGSVMRKIPTRPGSENSVIRTLPMNPMNRPYEML